MRYSLALVIPLKGKGTDLKTPFATVSNEILLNFGKSIIFNTFDQNRFYASIGYQFSPRVVMQVGYQNIFKQEASGNFYTATHSVRLHVAHSLDLRKRRVG
jgi:hypothetical protein